MRNRRSMPMGSPSCRRTRAQREWKVPAWTSRPLSPTSRTIRSRSSAAARFVKVTARIRHGATSLTPIRDATRMGEAAGLARAGPGQDEDGAVRGRDGARLLWVEASQDLALAGGLGL